MLFEFIIKYRNKGVVLVITTPPSFVGVEYKIYTKVKKEAKVYYQLL